MGVNVDETRCHDAAIGVDFACARVTDLVGNLGDHTVGDRYVGMTSWRPGAIDHTAISNHDVWLTHEFPLFGWVRPQSASPPDAD